MTKEKFISDMQKFERGKQRISLSISLIALFSFLLESFVYREKYTDSQLIFNYSAILILSLNLILFFTNRERFYKINFLIVSYVCILTIFTSSIIVLSFKKVDIGIIHNFFVRGLFFTICAISFVGFISGRIHIVLQGVLLLLMISYQLVVVKDPFILKNASLIYIVTIGFCVTVYFLVHYMTKIIIDLEKANKDKFSLQETLLQKSTRLERYNQAMVDLSRLYMVNKEGKLAINQVYTKGLETIKNEINCSRVSVWLTTKDKKSIKKILLLENEFFDESEAEIFLEDYPKYFEAVFRKTFIAASNAKTNKATFEMADSYLIPLGIESMLDCPIRLNNEVFGVVCCESKTSRFWENEEILFVQSVADYFSISIKNQETERLLENLQYKNKEILSSINYAKRIQEANLPSINEINKYLGNCFILFKPKDIVSGDFYFLHQNNNKVVIAAADCTGHGVPGALLSMLAHEKLSSTVLQTTDTSEILQQVNKKIKIALNQSREEFKTYDGMDVGLCVLNKETKKISFASANRPIWILKKDAVEFEIVKGTKKAIGGDTSDEQVFDSHQFQLNYGDTFYLFSDGYADTFGGQEDKKLMTRRFRELLLEIRDLDMNAQCNFLNNFIENWKGARDQCDDILVIGIRI